MKKILCVVIACFSFVLALLCLNYGILSAMDVSRYNTALGVQNLGLGVQLLINSTIVLFLACIGFISLSIFLVISVVKGSNLLNFTRLTYEEYKQAREKHKAKKQAEKKEKLQKQLKELEE